MKRLGALRQLRSRATTRAAAAASGAEAEAEARRKRESSRRGRGGSVSMTFWPRLSVFLGDGGSNAWVLTLALQRVCVCTRLCSRKTDRQTDMCTSSVSVCVCVVEWERSLFVFVVDDDDTIYACGCERLLIPLFSPCLLVVLLSSMLQHYAVPAVAVAVHRNPRTKRRIQTKMMKTTRTRRR